MGDTVTVVKVPGIITTVTTPEGEIVTTVAGGQRGLTGADGAQGPQGPQGVPGVDGSTDALTLQGQNGAYYKDRDNHTGPSASKATPVDADNAVLLDSAASGVAKKLSWANIKATLKTYFDTLYAPIAGAGAVWGAITGTLSAQTDLQAALDAKQDDIVAADKQVLFSDGANNPSGIADFIWDKVARLLTITATAGGLLLQNRPGEYWSDLLKLRSQGYSLETTFTQGYGFQISCGGNIAYLGNANHSVAPIIFRLHYTDQPPFTPRIEVLSQGANDVLYRAKAHGLQAVNLFEFADSSDVLMSAITKNGSFMPPQIADASAANNTLYFSTDVSKLSYKDPSGTVNRLY